MALKSNGTVWAWGGNFYGQLGIGNTTNQTTAVQVTQLSGVTAIGTGQGSHSLAVKSDGTVWAWGWNAYGQLGNGTTTDSSVPVQVPNLSGVTEVATGTRFSVARKSDGTVWTWGLNTSGELGNGTTTDSHVPTQTAGFAVAAYTYDGDGLRATVSSGGVTRHFAWDISANLPVLLTDGSTSYIYDDTGLPVEQIDGNGTPLYYHQDELGSTRLLTDQSGNAAATYTYDAYGNLTSHTGAADTPLRFAGEYQDSATGLYYLRARYYDPVTAQFLSRDPVVSTTQEPYSYASNDPLNTIDPSGLAACAIAACGVRSSLVLTRACQAFYYFWVNGLTKIQAAAIVGNLIGAVHELNGMG